MDEIKKYLSEFNNVSKENDDIYKGLAKKFGLPDCSFWIIYQLRSSGKAITQSEICNDFYAPKQTVSSAIQKLLCDGYIEFAESNDKRSKPIVLTKKGKALAKKTVDKVINAELLSITELTAKERDAFMSVFRKYTDLLKSNMNNIT